MSWCLWGCETYIFANDLFEGRSQDLPGEDLDVFLDVTGLRIREPHDNFKELFAVELRFRNSHGPKPFQIPTNAVLLFNREPYSDKGLQKVDGINAGNETFIPLFPPYAADDNAFRWSIIESSGGEVCVDGATILRAPELHETSLGGPFFSTPALSHQVQIGVELQDGFMWIDNVGIKGR